MHSIQRYVYTREKKIRTSSRNKLNFNRIRRFGKIDYKILIKNTACVKLLHNVVVVSLKKKYPYHLAGRFSSTVPVSQIIQPGWGFPKLRNPHTQDSLLDIVREYRFLFVMRRINHGDVDGKP